MKIIVKEHKKISPFMSLFYPSNKQGKDILKSMGLDHFNNTQLYALTKIGFKIILKKSHKKEKKHDHTNNSKKQ